MAKDTVSLQRRGRCRHIVIDRPEAMNAIDPETEAALVDAGHESRPVTTSAPPW